MRNTLAMMTGLLAALPLAGPVRPVRAQNFHGHAHIGTPHFIIPQSASTVPAAGDQVTVTEVNVGVVITQQVATTVMEISIANPTARIQESVILLPVPDAASVNGFDFQGAGKEASAKLLPKAEARATYDNIVRTLRDPALLEFAGYNLIKSSVFPVPAHGTQKVRLTYEQILTADGDRIDYILPRSESLQSSRVPWKIAARIKSKKPISTVYSPSHEVAVQRDSSGTQASVRLADAGRAEPGPFRLSYLVEGNGVSASMFAYPDPANGGGYFLLLAGVPAKIPADAATAKREVTMVIDTSGSMAGEKMDQVRAAALQVLEGLRKGEAFNIIDYNTSVSSFADKPVIKTDDTFAAARTYVKRLEAEGGTNIHDALIEALRPKPTEGMLPIVLFLTDGIPTIRVRSESAIRAAAEKANVHGRRIFTFGVGYDVNAPLLTGLARTTRAVSTFVMPKENVEDKVSQVYRRLAGPVLAGPTLRILDAKGEIDTRTVRDLQPNALSDLFEGDQLVVLGKYRGEGKLKFQIEGSYLGTPKTFEFELDPAGATVRNAFVPRLWASRKIAALVEEIREAGAQPGTAAAADPKFKELTDQIVRLSTEFGILTEYTSFLALEGTDLSAKDKVVAEANKNLHDRAYSTRAGIGAVNQDVNSGAQISQQCLNYSNKYWDQNMKRVEVTNVRQVCDRAFYRRGNAWVDGAVLEKAAAAKPDKVVEYGTPEFDALTDRLVAEGRQGLLALDVETVLKLDGKTVLVRIPPAK